MKFPKLLPVALSLCAFAFVSIAHAQQAPAPSQDQEEIVRLSPFAVEERADLGRYQAAQVSSGSRIRMDLMEATQGISVITNEFMADIGTGRILDAVKYVAGVGASHDPNAMDTMNVRGFQSIGSSTLDGFTQNNISNSDPIIIDRIEVLKGPNAILSPQGLPGGVVNSVTKRPLFTNKGYISYQVGRWDANRAELDANYVVRPDKLAVRVVAAFTDADDYERGAFHQNVTVMPMFTYRISPATDFTFQTQVYNSTVLTNIGTPVSLYAYGRNNVRLQEGLPRDFQYAGPHITRHQHGYNTRFFLTSQITDKLSMRLAGNWAELVQRNGYFSASAPNIEVVKLNPITGEWSWDGVSRNDSPTYTLGGGLGWPKRNHANLQNDFLYEYNAGSWKSKTVMGYAINYGSGTDKQVGFVPDPTIHDFTDPNFTSPSYTIDPNWLSHSSSWSRSHQLYLYQVFYLFDDRLILNGGLTRFRYGGNGRNNLNPNAVPPPRPAGWPSPKRPESLLPSVGVVYKVTPSVSLYYGFTKQELPGFEDVTENIPPHSVPSTQHEGGVRIRLFDGKLYATLAYFDIVQDNLYIGDYRNFQTPRPDPRFPAILVNRTASGVEFEFTWAPSKNFSVIGSYTKFENRDQDNMRYSNVAENTAAIWGSYTFSETGPLRGLSVGIGANYVGERPGDASGVWTSPPPGFDPVRVQPMFWIPSYTLVEANVSYRFSKNWHAQLLIKNLLDRDYVTGAFLRGIYVSTPINPKLTIRYEF